MGKEIEKMDIIHVWREEDFRLVSIGSQTRRFLYEDCKNGVGEHYEIVKKCIRKRTLMETLRTERGGEGRKDVKR